MFHWRHSRGGDASQLALNRKSGELRVNPLWSACDKCKACTMPDMRPPIPEDVKREVRQRCFFGCIFCGLPVYDYDHIVDWSETQAHEPASITLLCPRHHSEKTRGLLTREQVIAANETPFNATAGVTTPYGLHFEGHSLVTMRIGSDVFQSSSNLYPIVIDDVPCVAFVRTDQGLGLWLVLMDEFNHPKVVVENNELIVRADAWDVRFEGQKLTIRDGNGLVFLRMRFEPPASITMERARILRNGVWIEVLPSMIRLGRGSLNAYNNIWRGEVALTAGYCPSFPAPIPPFQFAVPRYGREVLEAMASPILETLPDDPVFEQNESPRLDLN